MPPSIDTVPSPQFRPLQSGPDELNALRRMVAHAKTGAPLTIEEIAGVASRGDAAPGGTTCRSRERRRHSHTTASAHGPRAVQGAREPDRIGTHRVLILSSRARENGAREDCQPGRDPSLRAVLHCNVRGMDARDVQLGASLPGRQRPRRTPAHGMGLPAPKRASSVDRNRRPGRVFPGDAQGAPGGAGAATQSDPRECGRDDGVVARGRQRAQQAKVTRDGAGRSWEVITVFRPNFGALSVEFQRCVENGLSQHCVTQRLTGARALSSTSRPCIVGA